MASTIGIVAGRDLRGLRRFALPLVTGLLAVVGTWVEMTFRSQLQLASYVPSFLAEPVQVFAGALHAGQLRIVLLGNLDAIALAQLHHDVQKVHAVQFQLIAKRDVVLEVDSGRHPGQYPPGYRESLLVSRAASCVSLSPNNSR